jgi:diadenosine tetraphosphate (Ap4A) HIT family hydrolase
VPTLFTRILRGELPASFVWRDELSAAFLTINPIRPGHTLVVPVEEVDHWLDCPELLRNHLLGVAQTIGTALQAVYRPVRVGLMIAGLEVPHLHLHLVPVRSLADLDFARAVPADRQTLDAEASRIRVELERRRAG